MIRSKKCKTKKNKVVPEIMFESSLRLPRPHVSPFRFRHAEKSNFLVSHRFNIHEYNEKPKVQPVEESPTLNIQLKF